MNTHGVELEFGKHAGELITRVPVNYLVWMVNTDNPPCPQQDVARAEIARRGHKIPSVDLSPHAIDNASLRCRKRWHETKKKGEGLYTWLCRMTTEAIEQGTPGGDSQYFYQGMKLVIMQGPEFPVLKTIMMRKETK